MVVKIQPAARSLGNALAYNERKASDTQERLLSPAEEAAYLSSESQGHVLATVNVPQLSTLESEFERLRMKNARSTRGRRLENPTFHMSVNPGATDRKMSEEEMATFIGELMTELGYGQTPYRIYRHDDTGRTHYHVVGTRIGQDGKKISDSYENTRCEKICRALGPKYGFTYGLEEETPEDRQEEKDSQTADLLSRPSADYDPSEEEIPDAEQQRPPEEPHAEQTSTPEPAMPKVFTTACGVPYSEQIRSFHSQALRWSFSTPEQYSLIMRMRFRIEVKAYGEHQEHLLFCGLDSQGRSVTVPMDENELGIEAMQDMLRRCSEMKMSTRVRQRERLEKEVKAAAAEASSWQEFIQRTRKAGIYLSLSWTEQGELFGLTWLDRATRCVWKGSQTELTRDWLLQHASEKNWKIRRSHVKTDQRLTRGSSDAGLLEMLRRNGLGGQRQPIAGSDASRNHSEIDYGEKNSVEIKL